ncbi:hypothetical protein COCON_G00224730 [Conger conger]|uniref:Uncharacterized protein n=1 Tax=Conger conger TaxID=82655 RepID=A0A9Q1CWK0_CONCO|nr:hypothetical protein COCON_G00224730 [Conger conger]
MNGGQILKLPFHVICKQTKCPFDLVFCAFKFHCGSQWLFMFCPKCIFTMNCNVLIGHLLCNSRMRLQVVCILAGNVQRLLFLSKKYKVTQNKLSLSDQCIWGLLYRAHRDCWLTGSKQSSETDTVNHNTEANGLA